MSSIACHLRVVVFRVAVGRPHENVAVNCRHQGQPFAGFSFMEDDMFQFPALTCIENDVIRCRGIQPITRRFDELSYFIGAETGGVDDSPCRVKGIVCLDK